MDNITKQISKGDREIVRIITWFFATLGLNVSVKEQTVRYIPYQLVFIQSSSIFAIFSTISYAYLNRSQFDEAVTIAAYLGSVGILNTVLPVLYKNKHNFGKILQQIDNNIFTYTDEKNINVDLEWILQHRDLFKKTIFILFYVCFGFSLSMVNPIFEYYITGIFKISIFPSWYPWSQDTLIGGAATFIIQSITAATVFWYYYTFQVFLLFFIMEFLGQYKKLCAALSTLQARAGKYVLQEMNIDGMNVENTATINYRNSSFRIDHKILFNYIYRKNLVECIQHHQKLIGIFNLLKPWLTFFFTAELTVSTLTFAFVFYNLMQVSQPEKILTLVGSSFNVVMNLLSRCIIGEIFSEMNDRVQKAIMYDVIWYDQSKENKKLLVIFHSLTKKPNEIFAFYVFPASLFTFAGITRLSYSYFNLIKTTLAKK